MSHLAETSAGQTEALVSTQFDQGLTTLREFSNRLGGHATEVLLDHLRAQGPAGAALEQAILSFSSVASNLDDIASDLQQLAGSQENLARLASVFEDYLLPLKDPNSANFKIWTVQTGAAAGIPHILKYPSGSSRYLIDSNLPYHTGVSSNLVNGKGFEHGAVSEYAAMSLANSAYYSLMENMIMRPSGGSLHEGADKHPQLIALGLTAATATGRERRGADHVWLAVRTMEGSYTAHIELGKGTGQEVRNRQDSACNVLGINAILAAAGLPQLPVLDPALTSEQLIDSPDTAGKILSLEKKSIDPGIFEGPGPFFFKPDGEYVSDPAEVDKLINSDFILFPGSFETLHFGHQEAARRAQTIDQHLNHNHDVTQGTREVIFEICADNFDPSKGSISNDELARRVSQHTGSNWVVVTRKAPLFIQKLQEFKQASGVVLGYDTARRLVAETSYQGGQSERDQVLDYLLEREIKFYVLGRDESDQFKTARDLEISEKYRSLFVDLPGRIPISSTFLRELRSKTASTETKK